MRFFQPLLAAVLATACTAEPRPVSEGVDGRPNPAASDAGSSSGGTGETLGEASTGLRIDLGGGNPGTQCVECSMRLSSKQSGTLELFGEGIFASATLEEQPVYALGTRGAGRFIVAADFALPLEEETDCPLVSWLGRAQDTPRLLVLGRAESMDVMEQTHPAQPHLPDDYLGNPQRLRDDFDIVAYYEESSFLDEGEVPSDEEFITLLGFLDAGGGLVVSSEYAREGSGYLTPGDIASVNRLLEPLGARALAVDLDWGDAAGEIEFPCFPPAG